MTAGPRARALLLALAVLVGSQIADAQPAGKVPRIGMISEFTAAHPFVAAFRQGLRELGYTEGQNIVVEYRHTQGVLDRVSDFAAELIRLNVELLVVGGARSVALARAQTTTVPIVFATAGDPVSTKLVASLAHPGGNATGISILTPELIGKQLELLKTAVPKASRVAVLHNPANPATAALPATRDAARALGLEMQLIPVHHARDTPGAFAALSAWRASAVLVLPDPTLGNELAQIAALAAKHRIPAMYMRREFADAGGLLAYGPSFAENYRRAALYVDKILKGATPAALPVEQPSKFELVVNLKTAKALGLTIPQVLMLQADTLIE